MGGHIGGDSLFFPPVGFFIFQHATTKRKPWGGGEAVLLLVPMTRRFSDQGAVVLFVDSGSFFNGSIGLGEARVALCAIMCVLRLPLLVVARGRTHEPVSKLRWNFGGSSRDGFFCTYDSAIFSCGMPIIYLVQDRSQDRLSSAS
jgi:hypothetical protein